MKKLKYIAKYIIIVLLPLFVAISSCNDEVNLHIFLEIYILIIFEGLDNSNIYFGGS